MKSIQYLNVVGVACLMACLFASSCMPLTFDNEGTVNFDRYRTVFVEPFDSQRSRTYLIDELRRESGFSRVTIDPFEPVDLILYVWISCTETIEVDEDGYEDVSYGCEADFETRTLNGVTVDRGNVGDSGRSTLREAINDTLDEVAHHYLRPYRV